MSSEQHSQRFHIAIVGNVGTGKSTLARQIEQRTGCMLYLEDPNDYLFLRFFFVAPHDWGFTNELHFVITKIAQQATIRAHNQLAVQEMDAHATHGIWIPTFHEIGYTSQEEVAIMNRVYELLAATPISHPDLYIFLHASLETVFSRIRKRGRDFEELDSNFVHLIGILDGQIARFVQNAPHTLLTIDAEAVDFTKPSPLLDGVLDDICARIRC